MRHIFLVILVLVIGAGAGACATSSQKPLAISSLPKTMSEACNFYRTTKPQVVAYVDWTTANWNATVPGTNAPLIPGEQKKLLLQLHDHLPQLDALGVDVCSISDALDSIAKGQAASGGVKAALKNINWDDVLANIIKVAATAAQLKAQGSI